jgi:acyl carrier protein
MDREQIEKAILELFTRLFEVEDPQMDADLRQTYEFDSIDAIELLGEI